MAIYHCYCTEFGWCQPPIQDPGNETLWICLNRKRPSILVPGTEASFCYWKIRFFFEIVNKRVDLYVPPEWRTIRRDVLDKWIGKLRDDPYEDIVLGSTVYRWIPHALVPVGQRVRDIPIPGHHGWPESREEIPYWSEPRFKYSDGTHLPVRINRKLPCDIVPGMEKIYCYWKIQLPDEFGMDFTRWVPPEWRGLTEDALSQYMQILRQNMGTPILLGGVKYHWKGDTLVPEGQILELVVGQGYGVFNYHSVDDTDDEDELEDTLVANSPLLELEGSQNERNEERNNNEEVPQFLELEGRWNEGNRERNVDEGTPATQGNDFHQQVCRKLGFFTEIEGEILEQREVPTQSFPTLETDV